jgi:hypothetical protein
MKASWTEHSRVTPKAELGAGGRGLRPPDEEEGPAAGQAACKHLAPVPAGADEEAALGQPLHALDPRLVLAQRRLSPLEEIVPGRRGAVHV